MRDGARKRHQTIEPFADFLHQREGAERAGMTTRTCCDRNEAGRAFLDRLASKAVVDDVVQRDSAPAIHGLENLLACAERGNHHRYLPFRAGLHIGIEAIVRPVNDLVHCIGRCRTVGVVPIMRGQLFGDLVEPLIDLTLRAGIERGKRADDPGLTLRDHEFRPGNDEQRRSDYGNTQLVERGGQGHAGGSSENCGGEGLWCVEALVESDVT